ncbi:hypothetical protein [Natronorubrum sp. FCH18a]|uniref:hypothetical protein n=1 Tax=Natronorubrum sp. FCH18a TaxID=3447018 RepID=UPI003F51452B
MTLPASTADPPVAGKTTLYCFNCGHESPIEGDWNRRPDGDTVEYSCPVCRTTITTRPRRDRQHPSGEARVLHCSSD